MVDGLVQAQRTAGLTRAVRNVRQRSVGADRSPAARLTHAVRGAAKTSGTIGVARGGSQAGEPLEAVRNAAAVTERCERP